MIIVREEQNRDKLATTYGISYLHYEKIFSYMHEIRAGGNYGAQLRFSIYDACNKYAKVLLSKYQTPSNVEDANSIAMWIAEHLEMPLPIRLSTCKVSYKLPLEANVTDMLYKHIRNLIRMGYIRIALTAEERYVRHTLITISNAITVLHAMGDYATAVMLGRQTDIASISMDYRNAGLNLSEYITYAFDRSIKLYGADKLAVMPMSRWAMPVLEDYGIWKGCDNGFVPYEFATDEEAKDVYEAVHAISTVTKSQAANFNR